ncbi:MAG: spermidine/putrescine ABC transporter substrate-binding protein [Rhodoluna sp.]|nr:spermidine/putrescine ABC transporter substrate-binding protein [Rhodoluna sp.]MBP6186565.1 spermidine/putrescine ABC transporter substrate-binding protein [Rhodoluna sp.]
MKDSIHQDPMFKQLVSAIKSSQVTRRTALAGLGASATALTLAACAPAAEKTALTPAKDLSASEKSLIWHNWSLYMDEDDSGNYPTLQKFQAQTGIKVEYKIEIDDNDTYFSKVQKQLAKGQDIGADVACPTEWMAAKWIQSGFVQKYDAANIPNKANLAPAYLGAAHDPNRDYSMPYQGILVGITYNKAEYKKATGKDAPTSLEDLWNPALKGRVGVLSEMRDTIGLILMAQGIDITSESSLTEDAFMNAIDFFAGKVSDGQVARIKGNSYSEDLENGDTIAAIAWSGDTVQLNLSAETEKYGFFIPESGTTISADSFVVPMGATHKANVEELINYYYDPKVAAELAAWVNYVTPVVGAQEEAMKIDPALASNQLIFPSEDFLKNTHGFRALSAEESVKFSQAFQDVLLGA